MVPDIDFHTYYLQFIRNAKIDANRYQEQLNDTTYKKEEVWIYLDCNKDALMNIYGLDITTFEKEWVKKEFNPNNTLYNKVLKLVMLGDTNDSRSVILQLAKYCSLLRAEQKYIKLIESTNKRKNLKFGQYRKYVAAYYAKVHKCVLQGMGYKFANGIGTYCINHWKMDPDRMKKTTKIDFKATNAKKRELIAKGLKPYDDKEAEWYKARGIPYDGVNYRVYKTAASFYEITFIKSVIFGKCNLNYKHTEYLAAKYRGMSYEDLAEKVCHTMEDIYNLQVDIKFKLNIMLHKDPNKYLNFIRNAEQCKYKRGAHNS